MILNMNLAHESDDTLIVRVAWLYYVGGLNQEETAARLGLHRSRVNRLLSDARDSGVISIAINHDAARDIELEHAIARGFGLDFCIVTPPVGFEPTAAGSELGRVQSVVARRAVGTAGANFLKGKLGAKPITVGVSWGRTVEQVALQLSGVHNPAARFVSLIGSLTRNSASNPFEVVQAFASRTKGSVHFLPVPFIADSAADRQVLMSQRMVEDAIAIARSADLYLISVGELQETAVLRMQDMISAAELQSVRDSGAVCDTLGRLYDRHGREVPHPLSDRSLAVSPDDLRGRNVVLLSAGLEKTLATAALLRSGIVKALIIDGDSALALRAQI